MHSTVISWVSVLPLCELLSQGELPHVAHDWGISPDTNDTISARVADRYRENLKSTHRFRQLKF